MNNADGEARAFDEQITERLAHGHIPDLRRTSDCDYFYNNPWRRAAYVKLDFGQIFERIDKAIRKHGPSNRQAQVLEIGCGPGVISLELARAGHSVVGLDLSPKAIEVATQVAETDPWKASRGPLQYRVADFLSPIGLTDGSFDAVVMVGALHHFADQASVARRVRQLLQPAGLMIAHEPARDRCTMGLAAFVHFAKLMLAMNGGFFEKHPVPASKAELAEAVEKEFKHLRYEHSDGSKTQSPNDNDAGYREMHAMLTENFTQIALEDVSAFFQQLIGGLRFDEEKNIAMAQYIRDLDTLLIETGTLKATEFFFVGRK